ncbi:MAG: DNA-3-methyladenine glycosylase 2 family protein [Ruminococcus sp.]|nr:DNA-3-methyladenine glycosylase 2 family protein [Ruminococcus sp.]
MRSFTAKDNNIYVECAGFDLALTLDCGQAFRQHVNAAQTGGTITLYNVTEAEFLTKWDEYFDFNRDYEAIKREFITDPTMKRAIEFCGGIRILKQDPWETLTSFIISQNNNIPRIKLIIKRFVTYFNRFPTPEDLLTDISFAKTGFREKYLKSAAENVLSGNVNLSEIAKMPTEKARAELMKISGVGPKVAECTLLYGFHRLECFPRDVWINRALAEYYPDGFPFIENPYAGVAQQYLFHYIRNRELCESLS